MWGRHLSNDTGKKEKEIVRRKDNKIEPHLPPFICPKKAYIKFGTKIKGAAYKWGVTCNVECRRGSGFIHRYKVSSPPPLKTLLCTLIIHNSPDCLAVKPFCSYCHAPTLPPPSSSSHSSTTTIFTIIYSLYQSVFSRLFFKHVHSISEHSPSQPHSYFSPNK